MFLVPTIGTSASAGKTVVSKFMFRALKSILLNMRLAMALSIVLVSDSLVCVLSDLYVKVGFCSESEPPNMKINP